MPDLSNDYINNTRKIYKMTRDELYKDMFGTTPPPKRRWYKPFYSFSGRSWNFPKNWYYEIKFFIQRGRRGWSDRDVWSLDNYFADVISQGVDHLRKNCHGYPSNLSDKEWNSILETISEGFKLSVTIDDDLFIEDCKNDSLTNDQIREKYKERVEKISKAFDLFKEYFRSLWD